MAITFDDSISKYIIIYHHFLDGLINTKVGNTIDLVMTSLVNFITSYNLIDKIHILYTKIVKDNLYRLEFFDINYETINYNINFNYKEEHNYETELDNLKKYLSFCIFPTSFNEHLSSSIIFIKDNRLYFFILNSGEDINFNNNIPIKIGEYSHYQLTKGIILCNNIDIKDEFIIGINKLKKILFLSFFYKYIIQTKYKSEYLSKKEFNQEFFYFFEYIKKNFISTINFNNQIINIKSLHTDRLKEFLKKENKDKVFMIVENYYRLIAENLINVSDELQNISNLDICDIYKYNLKYTKKNNILQLLKGGKDKMRKDFIKKIILYYDNENFYIRTQESGSCTWFAIYYSIILYFVIFNDFDVYVKFITDINSYFYDKVQKIFTLENFKKTTNFIYMKKLYSKFIDIGLIENNLLFDIQDILYDVDINLYEDDTPNNNYIKNDWTYDYINFELISEKKFLDETYENFKKEGDPSSFNYCNRAYKLFILQNNGQFFFKENDNIDLEKFICNLNFLLNPFDKDRYRETLKTIREVCLNSISIFKETYNFEMTQNCPSYIFYFIPIILYINNIKRDDDCIILDFKENKNKLFQCCIIYFRLYLINNLFLRIINIVKDEEITKNLLKIIILLLINYSEGNIINQTKYFNIKLPFDINYFGIFDSNLVTFRRFDYYESFNTMIESFNTMIDNYLYLETYLYDNPNYINENFLIYNIARINEKPEIKEKLIKFYSQEYYLNLKNGQKEDILDNIIKKLIILLYQYPIGMTVDNIYLRYIEKDTFMLEFKKKSMI